MIVLLPATATATATAERSAATTTVAPSLVSYTCGKLLN